MSNKKILCLCILQGYLLAVSVLQITLCSYVKTANFTLFTLFCAVVAIWASRSIKVSNIIITDKIIGFINMHYLPLNHYTYYNQ